MPESAPLLDALRRYWGYHEFRPRQESIIRSLLAGHDACVVMPTGGGKSLCYQLPAVVSGKTTIVVSPLIALMQDQAAQLAQMGIPAGAVNSFQNASERRQVMQKAARGEYRLLYLSPERLAQENTFEWLSGVPVGFFAVDEAHCISEWGHEFRPDYRQLSRLRTRFPDLPIAAFTASATRQVRHDILKQLQMRTPDLCDRQLPSKKFEIRGARVRSADADGVARPRFAALRGGERDRVFAHDSPSGRDGRISGGERDCGDSLSREDGIADAPAEPGTMDVGRSAGAGGNDCVWPRHQQARGTRGDSPVAAEVD